MSKYIRTKNGIYDGEKYDADYFLDMNLGKVAKQADTIEELCDCFVTEGNRHIVWDKQQNKGITFEQVKESFTSYHFKIYGAIWTDEGLIYVAKMNEEGELVLI